MTNIIQTSSGSFASEGLVGMQIENPLVTLFARVVGLPLIIFGLLIFGVGIYSVFKDYMPSIGDAEGFLAVSGAVFTTIIALVIFAGLGGLFGLVGLDLLALKRPSAGYVVLVCLFLLVSAIGSWAVPVQDNTDGIGGIIIILYAVSVGGSYFLTTLRNVRLQYDGNEMVAKNLQEKEAKLLIANHGHLVGRTTSVASAGSAK